jgi:hypothetical protein
MLRNAAIVVLVDAPGRPTEACARLEWELSLS